uniref:TFIIS N-terminal domain-containing protein n=1 Tax=Oryza glaberrima TaxID=4538 RepID=I1PTP6_ORYGL
MAAARNPLRRWKTFLAAFASVDDAIEIEAADLGISRGEIRRARGRIVEMLRGAEDGRVAEELCSVLDEVMAESLLTLRLVPVTPRTLATTDLAGVVGALRKHDSERIRGLATDIVRRCEGGREARPCQDRGRHGEALSDTEAHRGRRSASLLRSG